MHFAQSGPFIFQTSLTGQQWAHIGASSFIWLVVPLVVGLGLVVRAEVKWAPDLTHPVTSSGDAGSPRSFVGFDQSRGARRGPEATEAVMQITTTKLTRAAGLAAVAAGVLFIAVQVKHPEITLDFVTTTQWKIRQGMKVAMATLALAGIAAMYLRQVRQIGILGLVGYLLFSLGYLAMLCVETIALVVVPAITPSSPEYVNGVVAVATNSSTTADIGLFGPLNMLVALGYILGGLLFGIALFRAGVLARWAAALLAVAAVATMAPVLLPMVNQRLFAVPNGIAMIGLGWALWREQRSPAMDPTATTMSARLDPAGAR